MGEEGVGDEVAEARELLPLLPPRPLCHFLAVGLIRIDGFDRGITVYRFEENSVFFLLNQTCFVGQFFWIQQCYRTFFSRENAIG